MFPQNGDKFPEIRFDGFSDEWEQRKLGELFKRVNERNSGEFNKSHWISVAKMYFQDPEKVQSNNIATRTYVMRKGDIAFEGHPNTITSMMTKLGLSNITGLIILYLAYAVPQTLFLYVGYIKTAIPVDLDEAAEIDGCGKFRMYFQIMFPLMKPMHATTLIINALWIWNDFLLPLLLLNKDDSNWTLPLFQYNYQGQYFSDYGPSFASYVVGIIVILSVYLVFQRNIISGMTNGSVK